MKYILYWDNALVDNAGFIANGFHFPNMLVSIRKDTHVRNRYTSIEYSKDYYARPNILNRHNLRFWNTRQLALTLKSRRI